MKNKKKMLFVVIFFSLGCVFDHVTTVYGTSLPVLTEKNPAVLFLMGYGVWHEVETLIISIGIFCGLLVVRTKSNTVINRSMKTLMMAGLIRFCVGFQNLAVIAKALS